MDILTFVRPAAFWLVLPLLAAVVMLLRRGGDAERQPAPVWLFEQRDRVGPGRTRVVWRNPLAAGALLAGLLWIAAWGTPVVRPASPADPGLLVLDLGVLDAMGSVRGPARARGITDPPALARALQRLRQGGRPVQIYVAGRVPPGPFDDLRQARTAAVAADGPTVGELLDRLAPARTQPVEVFSWRVGPPSRGDWRSQRWTTRAAEHGRIVVAVLDVDGLLSVAAAGPTGAPLVGETLIAAGPSDTVRLRLDADGRAEADLSAWIQSAGRGDRPGRPGLSLRLPGAPDAGPILLEVPHPTVAWLACADSAWADAIEAWPGFDVRAVDRARIPADPEAWEKWRAARGGGGGNELFVAVGAPPPALPDSVPQLWIAPLPGQHGGLTLLPAAVRTGDSRRVDASQVALDFGAGALWQGLDLTACPPAVRPARADPGWIMEADGRVLARGHAAVLNLRAPRSNTGTAEPALAALRLARRMVPAPRVVAGPGLPSPPWQWPAEGQAQVSPGAVGAAAAGAAGASRWTLLAALGASVVVLVVSRGRRWARGGIALALAGLAALALRAPAGELLLVLDASPSCRAAVPKAAAAALESARRAGGRAAVWIAALDGEGGRWLATPMTSEQPPRRADELEPWIEARLAPLPRPVRSRLAPALRSLRAPTSMRRVRTVLVSDGHFEDTPRSLAAALPPGPVGTLAVPAGRVHDAAIVALELRSDAAAPAAFITADDGGAPATLVVQLDGAIVGQHDLMPSAEPGRVGGAGIGGETVRRVRVALPAWGDGAHRITARIQSRGGPAGDPVPEDDELTIVRDDTAPSVLWVSGDGQQSAARVGRAAWPGERAGAAPASGAFARPDVWVLDAVAESVLADLEPRVSEALDRGSGLVMLAGPGSWLATGRSGVHMLEARLPVRLRVPEDRAQNPPPWMVLLDASGSMATVEDGQTHFERAVIALASALASARAEEAVGVLAFAERVLAVAPPEPGLTREQVQSALHGVRPSGGTLLLPALEQAAAALRALPAPGGPAADAPRLVVLSDGLTGPEDPARWQAAVAGCRVVVLEIGSQGTPALRQLAAATGGHHRLLRSLDDLAAVLGEEAVAPPRDRMVTTPDTVRTEDPAWAPLAPPRVGQHVALAPAEGHAPWTLGRLRDPLLALGEAGPARVAVLTTTPGAPWAEDSPRWASALAAMVAWAGRRDEPVARWDGGGAPRLAVDPRAVRWASGSIDHEQRLLLVDSPGDTTRLEAALPGVYRPLGTPPVAGAQLVDAISGARVARLPALDPVAELRARGVDRSRLQELATIAEARSGGDVTTSGSRPRPLPVAAGAVAWIAAVAGLALRAGGDAHRIRRSHAGVAGGRET